MRSFGPSLVAFVLAVGIAPAQTQFTPPPPALHTRTPAPRRPPPRPPIITGPLQQAPPPGVYSPPRLNTHSDRAVQCLQEGSSYGLRGNKLQAYARSCANAN